MRNKFILIVINLILISCGSQGDKYNKRIPDEFMVESFPSLQYPKNYNLVTPAEIKSTQETLIEQDINERIFLEHFNDDTNVNIVKDIK